MSSQLQRLGVAELIRIAETVNACPLLISRRTLAKLSKPELIEFITVSATPERVRTIAADIAAEMQRSRQAASLLTSCAPARRL